MEAPNFDPDERRKRRHFAEFKERAYDEFGRPVRRVVVTDVEIPFWSMVGLLVQLGLAAIPALIILALTVELVRFLWAYVLSHAGR